MLRSGATALVVLGLASAAFCDPSRSEPAVDAGASTFVLSAPPTTSPAIALSNLDAEIAQREKRAREGREEASAELVGRYLVRARYVGLVSDLESADATSAAFVAAHEADAKAHANRASALSGIHEFASALQELDRAAALKAPPWEIARARAGILLAMGRTDEAAALAPAPAASAPIEDIVLRAGIDAQLGQPEESDRLFCTARALYHDVSPFTVAWIDFEHSRALEMAGERAKARAYLEEAASVMPSYAHAVAHLAALEPPEKALASLEGLRRSDDPEVLAATADALRRSGRRDESVAVAARAKARYEEVLSRLPLAFADHAASFYLGVGRDPGRALELARVNARNRPTDESIELMLSAAQAAESRDDTCAASAMALARPHASPALRERATAASRGCP